MRNRFSRKKSPSILRNLLISVYLFAAVFFIFCFGIFSVSEKRDAEELLTLKQAVMRGITYCYAMEASYPAALSDLKGHYGLFYDEDKYFIDYLPLGANIIPDVTIIRKTDH